MRLFISSLNSVQESTPENIKFLALGDLQYDSAEGSRGTPLDYAIRDSVRYATDNNPDAQFLLHVGDYMDRRVDEAPSQYPRMNGYINYFAGKKYATLGNHDVGYATGTGQIINDYYTVAPWGDFDSLHTRGYGMAKLPDSNVYLMSINTCEYGSSGIAAGTTGTGTGNITSAQMTWIKTALDSITEDDARLLVMTHIPLFEGIPHPTSPNAYYCEISMALEVSHLISKWQAESNRGLCIGIFVGHVHLNTIVDYEAYYGKLSQIALNDSQVEGGWSGYTGTDSVISTDEAFMQYSVVEFNETTKTLTVTGVGENDSYSYDMSDRITSPHIPVTDTTPPTVGTLTITNIEFRLADLNCTAADNVGVVGFEVWYESTGGDTADVPLQLWRTWYVQELNNFTLGRISSGATVKIYVIAFDEAGNKSTKSNTVTFTGG